MWTKTKLKIINNDLKQITYVNKAIHEALDNILIHKKRAYTMIPYKDGYFFVSTMNDIVELKFENSDIVESIIIDNAKIGIQFVESVVGLLN
jgi:hypothetical protein